MDEKKFPTLSCVLAIEVFCLALMLGISFRFAAAVSPFRFVVRDSISVKVYEASRAFLRASSFRKAKGALQA